MSQLDTIIVPETLTITAPGTLPTDPMCSVSLSYNTEQLTYDIANVSVTGGFDPIMSRHVNQLRLQTLLRQGIREQLYEANKSNLALMAVQGVRPFFKDKPGKSLKKSLIDDPTVETLDSVAAVYNLARLSHNFTNVAVGHALGLYRFQAQRLVRIAKSEGHIQAR